MKEKIIMQGSISASLGALAVYADVLTVPIVVLLAMMIVDYLSGMCVAWMRSELSSKTGIRGIIKKVGYMGLIVVGMGVDYLIYSGITAAEIDIGYKMWFGISVAVWLIINEMISILENLSKLDVPIPVFLTKLIERLKISVDKERERQADEKRN